MDWETPADGWYVWIGVSLISLAMMGLALGLPTGPPPDANGVANTIERTTGDTYDITATYEHDADEIKIEGPTVSLRNEHGTSHARLEYGRVVPVMGNERLEAIAHGASLEEEYEDADDVDGELLADLVAAHEENAGEWNVTSGELAVRTLTLEAEGGPVVALDGSLNVETGLNDDEFASEAMMKYTAEAGTELELEFFGNQHKGHEKVERDEQVVADGTQSRHNIDLTGGEYDDSYSIRYPFDVEVHIGDTRECTGEVEGDSGYETICEGGALSGDIGSEVDRIAHASGGGEYRVTLVTA